VEKYAKKALKKRNLDEVELSIRFVGRKIAKELNQKYRKMNYIPQVLGFPMSKQKDADGWKRLGDVVICNEKLKYEAKFQEKSISEILEFWLLHGVDNLL
jgi:rRNA maturation RNase YbeY